jgi:hypothetical protein
MIDGTRRWICTVAAALSAACASTNDLSKDGWSATGGGFYDEEIRPQFFYVVAKTTVGPLSNAGAARGMWIERARRLCNGGFREIEVGAYADERAPGYIVSVRRGYALCDTAALSIEQAQAVLDDGARITATSPPPQTRE